MGCGPPASRARARMRREITIVSRWPLAGDWPYLWLDATYLKQREGGRIVSVAAIIAVAVNTEGKREIVGLHIGPSEAEILIFVPHTRARESCRRSILLTR